MRLALKKLGGAALKIIGDLDGRDYVLAAGLAMLGGALSSYSPAAGIGIPGAILVAVAIFGVR